MINYFVIIPAYNAEKEIDTLVPRILSVINDPSKIIIIDDGSIDLTAEKAKRYNIVLLKHKTNRGKGAALKTGFCYAIQQDIHWVFTLDVDNQHDPLSIPLFLQRLKHHRVDLLLGKRQIHTRKMPFDRYLSNQITSLLVSLLCGIRIYDSQCGFRLINLNLYKTIDLITDHFETESELLIKYIKRGAQVNQIPISTIYSNETSSIKRMYDSYRFVKMFTKQLWN